MAHNYEPRVQVGNIYKYIQFPDEEDRNAGSLTVQPPDMAASLRNVY